MAQVAAQAEGVQPRSWAESQAEQGRWSVGGRKELLPGHPGARSRGGLILCALLSARFLRQPASWPGRDSGKEHTPLHSPARCSFPVCSEGSEDLVRSGRPGFWPLLSGWGPLPVFLSGYWAPRYRRQPRRRRSLADWGRTPSKPSKCRSMKM